MAHFNYKTPSEGGKLISKIEKENKTIGTLLETQTPFTEDLILAYTLAEQYYLEVQKELSDFLSKEWDNIEYEYRAFLGKILGENLPKLIDNIKGVLIYGKEQITRKKAAAQEKEKSSLAPTTPPATNPIVPPPVTPPATNPIVPAPVTPPATNPIVPAPVTPPATNPIVPAPVTPPNTSTQTGGGNSSTQTGENTRQDIGRSHLAPTNPIPPTTNNEEEPKTGFFTPTNILLVLLVVGGGIFFMTRKGK